MTILCLTEDTADSDNAHELCGEAGDRGCGPTVEQPCTECERRCTTQHSAQGVWQGTG